MSSNIKSIQEAIKLIEDFQNFYEINNPKKLEYQRGVAQIIRRFLNKPEFFIREFIQNADDAKASEITIKVSGNYVEIRNNGEEFTKEQFKALSSIGKSTKELMGFIGYFGIGFKSIFYYTNEVRIASGFLRWKYNSDTICVPFKDYDNTVDVKYVKGTRISFKLKENKKDEFIEELRKFPREVILFLQNIKNIKIIINGECEDISKKHVREELWEVIINKYNSKREKYFIIKKATVKLTKEQSRLFLQQKLREVYWEKIKEYPKEIELSVLISVPIKNEYEIDDEYQGLFYVFLPTQTKTYLPCNINADFIVEQDRRFIDQESEINKLLIKKAIELIRCVIEYYKSADSDAEKLQVYKWLRKASFDEEKEPLVAYLHESLRKMFENEDLILIHYECYDNTDKIFFRKEEVVDIDEWLLNYLNREKLYKYLYICYKKYQVHPKITEVLREHGIEIRKFTFEDILRDLKRDPSLPTQPKKLLQFYRMVKDYWNSRPKYDEESRNLITNVRFVLLDNGTFTSISESDRSIYYVKSGISDKYLRYVSKYIYLLNRELTKEIKQAEDADEIFEFLKELGIKELTLKNIQDIIVEEINKKEIMNKPNKWKKLFAELINVYESTPRKLDKLKLPCYKLATPNKIEWCRPDKTYFSKSFEEILGYNLEVILKFSKDAKFIVSDFLESDFLALIEGKSIEDRIEKIFQFLKKQGVKYKLNVREKEILKLPKSWWVTANPVMKALEELKEFIKENDIRDFNIEFFVGVPLHPYRSNVYYNERIQDYVFGIINREIEYHDKIIMELRKRNREYTKHFSNMILRNWKEYNRFLKLKLLYSYKEPTYNVGEIEFGLSGFGRMLKEESWLLDDKGNPRPPLELFDNTEENRKLGLPTVNQSISLPPDLIEFLELNRLPDIEYLLRKLRSIMNYGTKEEIEDILWKMYLQVIGNEKLRERLKKELRKIPIWKDKKIELVPIDKVCWMSQIREGEFSKKYQEETILKIIIPLNSYYSEKFREFFIKVLGIPEIIPSEILVKYYRELTEKKEALSEAEVAYVLNIYVNANNYGIRDAILEVDKVLNLNNRFVPKSTIKFYCLNEDITANLLSNIKEQTLAVPKRLRQVRGSIYEVLFKELTNLEENSVRRYIIQREVDYNIDLDKKSLAFVIWNYKDKIGINEEVAKSICQRILNIKIKAAESIAIVYEFNGEKITSNIRKYAVYDKSKNIMYITNEKAQNEYVALFQVKNALYEYLSTIRGVNERAINELLSNCFGRPIEYVKEFLLSNGIKNLEDVTSTWGSVVEKKYEQLTKKQISTEEYSLQPKKPKGHQEGLELVKDLTRGTKSVTTTEGKTWYLGVPPEEAPLIIKEYKPKNKPMTQYGKPCSYMQPTKSFEHISSHTKSLSEEDKKAIGYWGEKYVFRCIKDELKKKYPDANLNEMQNEGRFELRKDNILIAEAIWLNKDYEKGEPYDIKVIDNGKEYYIEVKTTISYSKETFTLSEKEWAFMKEKGSNYIIYRVYGAATQNSLVVKIVNPIKLIYEGKIKVKNAKVEI